MEEKKTNEAAEVKANNAAESAAEEQTETKENAAELERLKKELEAAKDSYLRIAAEYENYRKRSAREKEAIFGDAMCTTVAMFLPVVDNLERALEHSDSQGLKEGLVLVMKQLSEILEKNGICEIDPTGECFDPELHNAIMHVEDETKGNSQVVEVIQKGYTACGRVVRHAAVKVAN